MRTRRGLCEDDNRSEESENEKRSCKSGVWERNQVYDFDLDLNR
jgi:hypothetical protein